MKTKYLLTIRNCETRSRARARSKMRHPSRLRRLTPIERRHRSINGVATYPMLSKRESGPLCKLLVLESNPITVWAIMRHSRHDDSPPTFCAGIIMGLHRTPTHSDILTPLRSERITDTFPTSFRPRYVTQHDSDCRHIRSHRLKYISQAVCA
jgi:hypothetical protein